MCGILLPVRQLARPEESGWVATPAMLQAMRAAALAISQQRPVLLEGPSGAQCAALQPHRRQL